MSKAELIPILMPPDEHSRSAQVDALLLEMAEMRQAKTTAETLLIYGRELESYDIDDIAKACRRIGMTERQEGETGFPTCPRLVSLVRTFERQRMERIRPEQLRPEVREALARDKRMALGSGEETFDVRGLIADVAKSRFSMETKAEPVDSPRVPPGMERPCLHCGNPASPQTSKTPFALSDYYRKRAENAAEAEAVKDNRTEPEKV